MEEANQQQKSPYSSKQLIIIAVIVILILLGIGGYYVMGQKGISQTTKPPAAASVSPTASAGMFGSIKDALSKSLSLQCLYDENGKKTTAYIKAGAVRADMSGGTKEENGSVIMKENRLYFWNGKEGIMMQLDTPPVPSGTTAQAKPSKAPNADFMEGLEKYKDACKPAVVSDALFTPPADVKFVDQTKMMEDAKKLMKGVTPGSAMSEEDVKKLMQQYQPSTTP